MKKTYEEVSMQLIVIGLTALATGTNQETTNALLDEVVVKAGWEKEEFLAYVKEKASTPSQLADSIISAGFKNLTEQATKEPPPLPTEAKNGTKASFAELNSRVRAEVEWMSSVKPGALTPREEKMAEAVLDALVLESGWTLDEYRAAIKADGGAGKVIGTPYEVLEAIVAQKMAAMDEVDGPNPTWSEEMAKANYDTLDALVADHNWTTPEFVSETEKRGGIDAFWERNLVPHTVN